MTVKNTLALLSQKDFPGQNTSEKDALKQTGRFFMIMRSCANELPLESKLKAMQTMVIPILTYASQVWYLTKTDMKSLESVQRRCTRWIAASSMSYKERLIKLNLLPILFTFKCTIFSCYQIFLMINLITIVRNL